MGKKHDKKVEAVAGKTPKGMKVDKAVKKFRKLEGKLWTREYLLKIAEFDGATIAPAIITLPEMYLVAAEAYLKAGDNPKALARLNEVHQRAGLPALTRVRRSFLMAPAAA